MRPAALFALVFLWPALVSAQTQTCAHPFDGASCLQTYSVVSISYMVVAGAYAVGAFFILAPRFTSQRTWLMWTLGAIPFCYITTILSFTVGGMLGWLTFPHDASPYFYVNWFVVVVMLLSQTAYVVVAAKTGIASD